jgi:hypothetical protein
VPHAAPTKQARGPVGYSGAQPKRQQSRTAPAIGMWSKVRPAAMVVRAVGGSTRVRLERGR